MLFPFHKGATEGSAKCNRRSSDVQKEFRSIQRELSLHALGSKIDVLEEKAMRADCCRGDEYDEKNG